MEKYNSTDNQRQQIKVSASERQVFKEISADFTLPDYQPEIKRLLRVGAEVLLPECSFGMNDCEICGNIDYYVIYLGIDNQMYCAPLSSEYRMSIPLDNQNGLFYDGDISVGCEFTSGRVTAKRKLSIRSKLCAKANIYGNTSLENDFASGADPSYTERLEGECKAGVILRGVSDIVKVSDEIIPDNRNGEIRVICAEGRVGVSDVSAQNGEVGVKGDIYLKLILCADTSNSPYTLNRKIPFSASVKLPDCIMGAAAIAYGKVRELSVIVEEGRIAVDMGIAVNATASYNRAVFYTKDMYSTLCQTECDYNSYGALIGEGGFNTNLSFGETRSLEELKISHNSTLVDISADALITSYEITESKAKLNGNIKYTLILKRDDEYSVSDIEFPFVYMADIPAGVDRITCQCSATTSRGRIDGERIGVDSEIYICGLLYSSENINAMSALHFGELVKKEMGCIRVCYPSRTDSVWSVAKRYNITKEKLISSNPDIAKNMGECAADDKKSLEDAKYLIIG